MRFIATALLSVLLFSVALPATAQVWDGRYDVTCNQSGQGPCTFCDALKVASNIIDFLIEAVFVIAVLMIVYGALMMMVSAGNEQRYTHGKGAITNAVIGIVIALGSWIIVNTLLHIISGNPDLPWATITC